MLKRQLGLWQTVMLGIGAMISAGIFSLVGVAGVEAGSALWLAFVIGAVVTMMSALSYAELASMFPNAGSVYIYSKNAFGSRRLSFLMGWFLITVYVAASATIASGFAQYFVGFVPGVPAPAAAAAILILPAALNCMGLKNVSFVNMFTTLLKLSGLLAFIILFFMVSGLSGLQFSTSSPNGFPGIISAAIIVFFAYLGFEVLATVAEEVKDVRKTLPRAILLSISITALFYILISLAFTSLLSYDQIVELVKQDKGALAVAGGALGGEGFLQALGIIALLSMANTIIICLMGASRTIYGMAEDCALPTIFLRTTSRGAPAFAIAAATLLALPLVFTGNLSLLAQVSVSGMFIVFIVDNLSVVVLRHTMPDMKRPFIVPLSIGRIPIIPILSCITLVSLLAYEFISDPALLVGFGALAILGILANEGEYRLTGD
ncbi:MAG: APC family permease [Candidatus Burarchaeum sp.]|nr:APC family permease [Candidatus Burarchaeum sp.]MDO8339583.1 APC family permease [Candidatus Burarchaeum sp.]